VLDTRHFALYVAIVIYGQTCSVVELRQYTLVPGTRQDFIELFEREFVETQHAAKIRLLGTFADTQDSDRFVWMRGFPDMPARRTALSDFYTSAAWLEHRNRANSMIVDSDDVRLLRPPAGYPGLEERTAAGPAVSNTERSSSTISIIVQEIEDGADAASARAVPPPVLESDPRLLAVLETEPATNTFPQLPVIDNERVLVAVVGRYDHPIHDSAAMMAQLLQSTGHRGVGAPRALVLWPTSRSAIF